MVFAFAFALAFLSVIPEAGSPASLLAGVQGNLLLKQPGAPFIARWVGLTDTFIVFSTNSAQPTRAILSSMPSHFSPAAMTFLRGLARHNDRNWFNARKNIYETELKAPMLALIDEITQSMANYAPEHMRPAHKSMMRIYRDIRFSPDKRPYKTHLSAWWTRRGMEKTSGGGFYLHIGPKDCFLAAGVYMPERDQLLALRRWMAGHHREYTAQLNKLLKPRASSSSRTPRVAAMQPIDPEALSRMPKGFPADHPAGILLRSRNWGVRCVLPTSLALSPTLAREVIARFRATAAVVDTLNTAILSAEKPSAEPLRRVRANAFL